ncbi:3,4-dihydroxy-2-butanone-4-phosphate synthase [Moraxella bovis]|uniref:bifunctional 3,4-dihydroxy-2-butanone-4-phosphate synthase/GTP cyclohydrolase II n=1 Tax=Moraxella bovis TaxID=476 RepID=UPI000992F852|nr:bifunctional 3,4-dihydroxy-2-butanone-4-phosphate synthase/GTP cyclohydrolase II [Moraxella bovis]OOR87468.1 3,4-dihydroxy-2-butanone-4-phosphate synthase [Moraxella bovis]UYZ89912.1 3,4-dihydroxy-2-butanone-4-phosphate synthase [Moraxella bovis]UYZ94993.1 3,4-dihydroxy-2-butanone-4-phosphate synthase [Moraxella bovis]UZA16236.1 3,4-dihydroxy-2-butanone-4-phosphate synthase [Moraxella bovis]
MASTLNTAEEIIADIKAGKMVILMDDEDRENEGDIVMAAVHVKPSDINFMITHARGLVCLTLSEARCRQLELPLMSDKNGAKFSTNFTLSIEASEGVTTGISAADRARTVQAAVAPFAKPTDIVQPGHIFPIMAKQGGVLHRAGHTEAGCDLARLAGLEPAAVICEIIKPDGEMARRDDLELFAKEHGLKIGTIADLIHYRMTNEQTVEVIDERDFASEFGAFKLYRFREYGADEIHIALVKGDPSRGVATVRVHALNPLKDLFGHTDSKHSWDIRSALAQIGQSEQGVFVWIDSGRAVDVSGALDKCQANVSVHESSEPYRSIGVGAQILKQLGVKDMRLLSSSAKFNVSGFDLNIVEVVAR